MLKKTLSYLFISPVIFLLLSMDSNEKAEDIFPKTTDVIHRRGYSLVYDGRTRNAIWVHQMLTQENLEGEAERKGLSFKDDPLISPMFRATAKDYQKSGFDQGHLCPAADACSSIDAMRETFYLSNISPQVPEFNRGYWKSLEKHVRDLTREHRVIHVYTGPLFLPKEESDGKRYVKYQVIGKNDIAVPTHYFKIVFDENKSPIEVYILPNQEIPSDTPLNDFKVTVEKIERIAGIIFEKT